MLVKSHRLFEGVRSDLEIEILKSERLRAFIILSTVSLLLIGLTAAHLFAYPMMERLFHNKVPTVQFFGVIGFFVIYEAVMAGVLTFLLKKRIRLAAGPRIGNALLETSLPSIGMLLYMMAFPAIEALQSPLYVAYFLFIIISGLRMNFSLSLLTSAIAAAEYLALFFVTVPKEALNVDGGLFYHPALFFARTLLLIVAGLLTGFVADQGRRRMEQAWKNQEDRNKIVSLFGQHVSPSVVQKLLDQPDLSETRPVAVLFLDIRGFTSYAESRSPEEVVEYLNSIFDFMIGIVNKHHGIINKFLGDGFMAVFGAPLAEGSAERHSLEAALELREELARRVEDGLIPRTRIGIGIDSGGAVTGSVGSQERREYTVIGNVVNTASRLETLNKELGTTILVSSRIWDPGRWDGLKGTSKGSYNLRGKEEALEVWEIPEQQTIEDETLKGE